MTGHDTYREMLAWRTELPLAEETALRAHLEDCPECRALAEAYAHQTFLLRALPEAVPPPTLRAGVFDAIRREPAARVPIWRRPTALVPLAAALLVAGIGLSTVRPLSGGHRAASNAAASIHATPKVSFGAQTPDRLARATSSSSARRTTRRLSAQRAPRPIATSSPYVPPVTVAQNPAVLTVPPIAVAPPVMPTPTSLPAVIHVAEGPPPANAKPGNGGTDAAAGARKASHYAPVAGGAPPVPAAPRHTAPPVPTSAPAIPTPEATPPPTPAPFGTPAAAYSAPVSATATAFPTGTPPPTPAALTVPYSGPQATPTPTP